mmetsp:Transcript_11908/g.31097  ORF Transcript_11908/g.31097 Transcript_11908/m.31097 type:complete len:171 (+) Transcript_11908:837-1349(+)
MNDTPAEPAAPPEPSAMTVAQLKAELRTRAVPCGGVFDRHELEALLERAREEGTGDDRVREAAQAEVTAAAKAAPSTPSAADAEQEELRELLKSMPGGDKVDVDEAMVTMRRAMADPQALSVLQDVATNPKCMQAMQELATQGDAAYEKYANDREVMEALSKLTSVLGSS